jgi:hypothetical protein
MGIGVPHLGEDGEPRAMGRDGERNGGGWVFNRSEPDWLEAEEQRSQRRKWDGDLMFRPGCNIGDSQAEERGSTPHLG